MTQGAPLGEVQKHFVSSIAQQRRYRNDPRADQQGPGKLSLCC